MTTWKLEHNDVIEWAKNYDGPPFHAALLDPPYHLTSITKRFGKEGSAPAKGDVYRRASAGFMNQVWDGGGISFDPETWAALAEHLYPGAFGMTFASPRTHHRIACAIEDAGMIIQPTFYCWVYLSGFPKATRIKGYGSPTFKGHRYGGQAIKPSVEPVILWQKPYGQRPVDSIVSSGAGALNIDGGRIGTEERSYNMSGAPGGNGQRLHGGDGRDIDNALRYANESKNKPPAVVNGRWPSNFILSHSPLDNGECHPDCPVRLFDEQAGESVSRPINTTQSARPSQLSKGAERERVRVDEGYDDSGPASRMFYRSTYEYEAIEANAPLMKLRDGLSEREQLYVIEELKKAGVL